MLFCKTCWWQEGGKCYNKEVGLPEGKDIIDYPSPLPECSSNYLNKRKALSEIIPNEFLVICSEGKEDSAEYRKVFAEIVEDKHGN